MSMTPTTGTETEVVFHGQFRRPRTRGWLTFTERPSESFAWDELLTAATLKGCALRFVAIHKPKGVSDLAEVIAADVSNMEQEKRDGGGERINVSLEGHTTTDNVHHFDAETLQGFRHDLEVAGLLDPAVGNIAPIGQAKFADAI